MRTETPRPTYEVEHDGDASAFVITFADGTEVTVRENTLDFSPVIEVRYPGQESPTGV